jgi:hypothetical protein
LITASKVAKMMRVALCLPGIAMATYAFSEQGSHLGVGSDGKSFAVAFADVNNDGKIDMFVTNDGSANRLYINPGNEGKFTDATSSAGLADDGPSRGAVFADVNGDGHLDLFVTASSAADHLYLGDGSGGFKDFTSEAGVGDKSFGQGACFADVDGDGDLDLFVANFGQTNNLYINDGKGVFANATKAAGLLDAGVDSFGCTFGDVDEDGDLDLYISNAESYNNLYLNNGKGVFTDVTEKAGVKGDKGQGRGVSFADLNGDGHLDLYMVAPQTKNMIFFGDGTGKFADGCESAGVCDTGAAQGMSIADVDGDGDLDIFVSNILEPCMLYENDGSGHFKNIASKAGVDYHLFGQGVAFGDLNEDGLLDMYVDTYGTPPAAWPSQSNKLLMNVGKKPTAWLKVRPVTETGAATLLGTEVRLFQAGTRKPAAVRMQIDGGSNFCSQNAYDAYFGLSTAVAEGAKLFDIEVRCGGSWIGKESNSKLGGVAPNQTVSVHCSKNVVIV